MVVLEQLGDLSSQSGGVGFLGKMEKEVVGGLPAGRLIEIELSTIGNPITVIGTHVGADDKVV